MIFISSSFDTAKYVIPAPKQNPEPKKKKIRKKKKFDKKEGGLTMKRFLALTLILVATLVPFAETAGEYVYNTNGKIYNDGKPVGNYLYNRVTITCGEILFPNVDPDLYTDDQLDYIAKTWVTFKIEPFGMIPMVFSGGAQWTTKKGSQFENAGVAVYIGGKTQTIKVRNGEVVLWSILEDLHIDIKERMAMEIQNGNNYYEKLKFTACSSEVAMYFPAELLLKNHVKIIDP